MQRPLYTKSKHWKLLKKKQKITHVYSLLSSVARPIGRQILLGCLQQTAQSQPMWAYMQQTNVGWLATTSPIPKHKKKRFYIPLKDQTQPRVEGVLLTKAHAFQTTTPWLMSTLNYTPHLHIKTHKIENKSTKATKNQNERNLLNLLIFYSNHCMYTFQA